MYCLIEIRWTVAAIEYARNFSHTPFMLSLRSLEASRWHSNHPDHSFTNNIFEQHSNIIRTSFWLRLNIRTFKHSNGIGWFPSDILQMIFKDIWKRISIVSIRHCSPYANIYRSISSDYPHRFVSLTVFCKKRSTSIFKIEFPILSNWQARSGRN